MPNHLDFLVAFVGATRMGAVISPANPIYTGDELAFQLGTSGAHWTLTVEASLPKVKEALLLLAARAEYANAEVCARTVRFLGTNNQDTHKQNLFFSFSQEKSIDVFIFSVMRFHYLVGASVVV